MLYVTRVRCLRQVPAELLCRTRPKMENTTCPTNVLDSASVSDLMLLATLIVGGVVLVMCYAVSRRSRSRQDSQKSKHPSQLSSSLARDEAACRPRAHARARTYVRMHATLRAASRTGLLLNVPTLAARGMLRPRFFLRQQTCAHALISKTRFIDITNSFLPSSPEK